MVTAGAAGQTTQTITPSAVTSTVYVTSDVPRSIGSASNPTTYVTVTEPVAACSSTLTVSADATTTVYTGTYNGTVAKRTAGAYTQEFSFAKRQNPFVDMVVQRFGEPAMTGSRNAFEVDCSEQLTTYLVATSTLSATAQTTTVTGSAATIFITQTETDTDVAPSLTAAGFTVTSTITQQAANGTTGVSICTVTIGTASATTTQHIKCAPTNLITQVNGYGIGQTEGHANETQGLTDGQDASACCQTCVDTEGCAASSDDRAAGNCFLWYTTTPSCGLGFQYANTSSTLAAGKGFSVQSGCGTIGPVAA